MTPSELTELGLQFNTALTGLDGSTDDRFVRVDSITALFQFTTVKTEFTVFYTLTGRLRSLDAFGHFHIHFHFAPKADDDRSFNELRPPFEDVERIEAK